MDSSQSYDHSDRLSELPNSLILMILSLSETVDAVRTTVLSKRWRDLWTTVPRLKFVGVDPRFIRAVLAKWRGEKIFSFYLSLGHGRPADVDSWLLFAVEKQVEEMYVDFEPSTNAHYCPPQCLYSCSSITELHLGCCLLVIEGSVQWNQLKSLSLKVFNASCDDVFNKLLSGAPRLETMILLMDKIVENFSIQSTSLKKLSINNSGRQLNVDIMAMLRICAPNLLTLQISADVVNGGSCLFDVPSLTEASFNGFCDVYDPPLEMFYRLFRSICHVKKVELSELDIKLLLALKKKDMVVEFPNAEYLKHQGMNACGRLDLLELLDLLEMFPKLKILNFIQHQDFNPTVETTFLYPSLLHLNTAVITWPSEDPSIIPFIEFLLQNAPSLHKLVFRLSPFSCNRERFPMIEEMVRNMPRSSATAEVIIIDGDDLSSLLERE
ncbi:F-box/LRR-repeat protein At3g26922-like [Salvia miltiorrhiza]|uniref:F-box/LRR-repeat protein At3g26922-like n=1 Tax=Salvia miltiorrhiza TaxID=226208 RepID=UPI0025ABE847|nr:F-box/LRR-repeat protein At3g26922-like [Salvia miltiorrhiza]